MIIFSFMCYKVTIFPIAPYFLYLTDEQFQKSVLNLKNWSSHNSVGQNQLSASERSQEEV